MVSSSCDGAARAGGHDPDRTDAMKHMNLACFSPSAWQAKNGFVAALLCFVAAARQHKIQPWRAVSRNAHQTTDPTGAAGLQPGFPCCNAAISETLSGREEQPSGKLCVKRRSLLSPELAMDKKRPRVPYPKPRLLRSPVSTPMAQQRTDLGVSSRPQRLVRLIGSGDRATRTSDDNPRGGRPAAGKFPIE